ncbi:MAG: response regulator, partial [Myxococcota bacterium]
VRVVCIDDDPMILRLVTIALERGLGSEVIAYDDPVRAVRELRHTPPPDLVVMDAMMPDLDGYAVYDDLKRAWKESFPRVVFLTAGGPQHRERALASGAVAALAKPFQPNQLVRELERIIANDGISV